MRFLFLVTVSATTVFAIFISGYGLCHNRFCDFYFWLRSLPQPFLRFLFLVTVSATTVFAIFISGYGLCHNRFCDFYFWLRSLPQPFLRFLFLVTVSATTVFAIFISGYGLCHNRLGDSSSLGIYIALVSLFITGFGHCHNRVAIQFQVAVRPKLPFRFSGFLRLSRSTYMRFLIFFLIAFGRYHFDTNAEEAGTEATSYSTIPLVQDTDWLDFGNTCTTTLDFGDPTTASFKRSSIPWPCESNFAHEDGKCTTSLARRQRDESGMEVLAMQEDEHKAGSVLPGLRHVLGGLRRLLGVAGASRGASVTKTEKFQCAQKIKQERSRKGAIKRGAGLRKEGPRCQRRTLSFRSAILCTAWLEYTMAQDGFRTFPTTAAHLYNDGTCKPMQAPVQSGTQDLVNALKKAFQESAMPPGVREALEKLDASDTKQITKELHAATTALGKARRTFQEAAESRRQLRASWLRHLEESAKAWESQLEHFRASMAQLQDQEARALQEVGTARKTIQQLNQQGAKDAVIVDEQQTEMQDATAMDAEEEALRKRVHHTMSLCLAVSGGETQEISDEEGKDSKNPAKRPRSVEPSKEATPATTS